MGCFSFFHCSKNKKEQESFDYSSEEVDEKTSTNKSNDFIPDNIKHSINKEFVLAKANGNIPFRSLQSAAREAILSLLRDSKDVRDYNRSLSKILPKVATRGMSVSTLSYSPPPSPTKISKIPDHDGKSSEELKDANLYQQYREFLDAFFNLPVPDLIKDLFSYLYSVAFEHHHTETNRQRESLSSAFAACYQFGIMKQLPPSTLQDRIFACTFRNIFDNVFNIEASVKSGSTHDLWHEISDNSGYDPREPAWSKKQALVKKFLTSLCPQIFADIEESKNEPEIKKSNRSHHKK